MAFDVGFLKQVLVQCNLMLNIKDPAQQSQVYLCLSNNKKRVAESNPFFDYPTMLHII